MHGIVFAELKKYVTSRLDSDAWADLLKEGLGESKIYLAFEDYPDEEIVALVSTASKVTGNSVNQILEDFGEFIAPDLIKMYKHLIDPEWKTLDLIEHTEETIHHVVRSREKGSAPPRLKSRRLSPDEVIIIYDSPRRMCALAIGIARGVAAHYNEPVAISQKTCMLEGNSNCEISIRLSK